MNTSALSTEEKLAQAADPSIQLHRINIFGHDIRYITAGTGPAVLLIHGGNIGWGQWYPNISALSEHFTVYALDLPGAGRSSRIDFEKMDFERDLLRTVDEFVRRMPFEETHVVGSSNGGWIAMKLHLMGNPKVKKLVLADSVGFSDYATMPDRVISIYPFARFLARTVLRATLENPRIEKLIRSVFFNPKLLLAKEFIDYFYETMATSHNLLFISRLAHKNSRKKMFLGDELSKISCHTLILWGKNDKLMPAKEHGKNFHRIPNAQVHVIENAGHIPSIEQAEEFNVRVIDFLTRS